MRGLMVLAVTIGLLGGTAAAGQSPEVIFVRSSDDAEAERVVRDLWGRELDRARAVSPDHARFFVSRLDLGGPFRIAVAAMGDSVSFCGSAGCAVVIFAYRGDTGQWSRVLDAIGNSVAVDAAGGTNLRPADVVIDGVRHSFDAVRSVYVESLQ